MKKLLTLMTLSSISYVHAIDTSLHFGAGTGHSVIAGNAHSLPADIVQCRSLSSTSTATDINKCISNDLESYGLSSNTDIRLNTFAFLGTSIQFSDAIQFNASVQINTAKMVTDYFRAARHDANDSHMISTHQEIKPKYGINFNILGTIGDSLAFGPNLSMVRTEIQSSGVVLAEVDGAMSGHDLKKAANTKFVSSYAMGLMASAKFNDKTRVEFGISQLRYTSPELTYSKGGEALRKHADAENASTVNVDLKTKYRLVSSFIQVRYTI